VILKKGTPLGSLLTPWPVNRNMLNALRPDLSPSTGLAVAKRPLNATASSVYQAIDSAYQAVGQAPEDRIVVTNIRQADGQYVLLVAGLPGVSK